MTRQEVIEKLKDDPDAKMAYLKNFQAPQETPDNPLFNSLNFGVNKAMTGARQAIADNIQQAAQQVVQQPVQQAPQPQPIQQAPQPRQAGKMGARMAEAAERQKADEARRGKFTRSMTRPEAGMGAIAQGMDERPRGRKFSRAERPSARNMPTPYEPSGNRSFGTRPAPMYRSRKRR